MNVRVVVEGLPAGAMAAAATFYAEHGPRVLAAAAQGDVVIVLAAADHAHRGWRLAAVQSLAREAAPMRINAVAGGDAGALAEAEAWLAAASGITGQLFALDSQGGRTGVD